MCGFGAALGGAVMTLVTLNTVWAIAFVAGLGLLIAVGQGGPNYGEGGP